MKTYFDTAVTPQFHGLTAELTFSVRRRYYAVILVKIIANCRPRSLARVS